MKKIIISSLIIMGLFGIILVYFKIFRGNIPGRQSGPQLIIDTYTFEDETNKKSHSQKAYPIQIGSPIPVGSQETKITEITDDYIMLYVKPAKEPNENQDMFRADACLVGSDTKDLRINNRENITLSSCTVDAGYSYVIQYLSGK